MTYLKTWVYTQYQCHNSPSSTQCSLLLFPQYSHSVPISTFFEPLDNALYKKLYIGYKQHSKFITVNLQISWLVNTVLLNKLPNQTLVRTWNVKLPYNSDRFHSNNLFKTTNLLNITDKSPKSISTYSYSSQQQLTACLVWYKLLGLKCLACHISCISFVIIGFQYISQMFIISRPLQLLLTVIGFLALMWCWFLRPMILHWANTLVKRTARITEWSAQTTNLTNPWD